MKRAALIVLNVLMFAYGVALVVSMSRLAFTLHTIPFRILAGAIAVGVGALLVRVARNLWADRQRSRVDV